MKKNEKNSVLTSVPQLTKHGSTQLKTEKLFNGMEKKLHCFYFIFVPLNVLKNHEIFWVMQSFCFFCVIQGTKEKLMFPSTIVVVLVVPHII